jgi:hypothetical protein
MLKHPIREAERYFENANKVLSENAKKKGNYYTDTKNVKAEKIAILDGVLYIKGNNKMYKSITETYKNYNIMSALVLRNYLYQL